MRIKLGDTVEGFKLVRNFRKKNSFCQGNSDGRGSARLFSQNRWSSAAKTSGGANKPRRDKRLRPELSRPELLHQRNQTFQHRECRGLSPRYRGETESRLQENKRTMRFGPHQQLPLKSSRWSGAVSRCRSKPRTSAIIHRFTGMALCAKAVGVHWGSVVFGPMLTITVK